MGDLLSLIGRNSQLNIVFKLILSFADSTIILYFLHKVALKIPTANAQNAPVSNSLLFNASIQFENVLQKSVDL